MKVSKKVIGRKNVALYQAITLFVIGLIIAAKAEELLLLSYVAVAVACWMLGSLSAIVSIVVTIGLAILTRVVPVAYQPVTSILMASAVALLAWYLGSDQMTKKQVSEAEARADEAEERASKAEARADVAEEILIRAGYLLDEEGNWISPEEED